MHAIFRPLFVSDMHDDDDEEEEAGNVINGKSPTLWTHVPSPQT